MNHEAYSAGKGDDTARWLSRRDLGAPISSNTGAVDLPFQRWFRFKEAYSPAFVQDTLASVNYEVNHVLDPFGGSGTTALTAKMLGADSTSIEVNPFMADLIRAKTTNVCPAQFAENCQCIIDQNEIIEDDLAIIEGAPPTLRQPGKNGRFVFSTEAFGTLRALYRQSLSLPPAEARLARVLIASIIVECSNVVINGKGRRYRREWQRRNLSKADILEKFLLSAKKIEHDLQDFQIANTSQHRVLNGDSREKLKNVASADLAIFSPPYPNSFDYTDVYNLELWMLGYLNSRDDNYTLRSKTLRSHVQIKWPTIENSFRSPLLNETYNTLVEKRNILWNRNIPEMLLGYFDDLKSILIGISNIIPNNHHAVAAVGDSQYAGVKINVAEILGQIAQTCGFKVESIHSIRSMRTSAQHGGDFELKESAIRLKLQKDLKS